MKRNYKFMLLGISVLLFGFCNTMIWAMISQSSDWYEKHGTIIEKIIVLYMPITEVIVVLAPIIGLTIVVIGFFIKNKDNDTE